MSKPLDPDSKALVFLVGTRDLRRLFQDWPGRMQLAVCLMVNGDCRMIVHREEEGMQFLPRLQRLLAVPLEQVCFFPEIEGYSSRRLMYSEEKQLFALIKNSPDIVEEARDFTINFTYALEEGIDPFAFVSPTERDLPSDVQEPIVSEEDHAPEQDAAVLTEHDTKPRQRLHLQLPASEDSSAQLQPFPRFMQCLTNPAPVQGFRSLTDIQELNPAPDTCVIHPEENGWVAIDFPGCVGGQVTINNPGNIYLRDDRRMIALRSDMIGAQGVFLPDRVKIGVRFLPAGVREMLRRNVGTTDAIFENGLFFLSVDQARPVTPTSIPAPAGRPWGFWASAVAILAVVGIGLQSALFPQRVVDADGPIDWSEFQSGALSEDQITDRLTQRS